MRPEHQRLAAAAIVVVSVTGIFGCAYGLYSTIVSFALPSFVKEAVQVKLNDPAVFKVNRWDKISDSVYCVKASYVQEDLKSYSENDWYMVKQEGDGIWVASNDPGGCYFQYKYWYRIHD